MSENLKEYEVKLEVTLYLEGPAYNEAWDKIYKALSDIVDDIETLSVVEIKNE
jgi:hypothetical protein